MFLYGTFPFMVNIYRANYVIFTLIISKSVPCTLVFLSVKSEMVSQTHCSHTSRRSCQAKTLRCIAGNTFPLSVICAQNFPVIKRMYAGAVKKDNKQTFQSYFMVITSQAKLRHISYRVMLIYGTISSCPV